MSQGTERDCERKKVNPGTEGTASRAYLDALQSFTPDGEDPPSFSVCVKPDGHILESSAVLLLPTARGTGSARRAFFSLVQAYIRHFQYSRQSHNTRPALLSTVKRSAESNSAL